MHLTLLGRILTPIGFAFSLTTAISILWPESLAVVLPSLAVYDLIQVYYLPLFITSSIIYLAWSINAWFRPVAKSMIFSMSVSAAIALGMIILTYAAANTDGSSNYLTIAAVLLGAGLTSGFIVWVRVFATHDFYYSSTRIVGAVAGAAVLFFLITVIPEDYRWLVLMGTLIFSCCSLPLCIHTRSFDTLAFNHRPCTQKERYKKQFNNLSRPAFFAFATAFIWGLLRAYDIDHGLLTQSNLCISTGMAIASLSLFFLWSLFNDRYGFVKVFRLLTPILLLCCFLFFFLEGEFVIYLSAFSSYCYTLAWLLMLLICARDTQNKELHPFIAWGAFASCYAFAANILGYIIAYQISLQCSTYFNVPLEATIALLCFCALFVATYIDSHFKTEKKTPPPEEETEAEVYQKLLDSCESIANEYGLSPREREVFSYLARGRDVYHISEELFISASTVQFHNKNIYKKLNIHSKQELITLVSHSEH